MNIKTKNTIAEIIGGMFILIFTYAAISKWQEKETFRAIITTSLNNAAAADILVWLIPFIELITAGLLVIPLTRNKGMFLSALLMVVFTGYISYMLLFADNLPCSCGGVISKLNWTEHLVFNVLTTLLAFIGWHLTKKRKFLLQ